MIDQLIKMGKEQLSQSLKQKENLSDDQVNETFKVAYQSLMNGVKDMATSGNISKLTSAFNGSKGDASALTQIVMKNFVPQLSSKLGISPDKAGSIANMVIPFLIDKFASKETGTTDDDDLLSKFGMGGDLLSGFGNKFGGLFK